MKNKFSFCIVIGVIITMFIVCASEADLVIETKYGLVEGKVIDSGAVIAWLGVPFAKPPVGKLRWKSPQNPEPWEGVLKTTEFCSYCTQTSFILMDMDPEMSGKPKGSEDCLYLNIWRPVSEKTDIPVFLWLHGGSNQLGSGAEPIYDGANMAKKQNVVVVTINYRLGPFGWFIHEKLNQNGDKLDNSGNFGTLDIIKSLEWVKDNIANFGGNPNNITLAGESAGSFNTLSMLLSPLTKNRNLFHRAICQSGSLSPYIYETVSMETAYDRSHKLLEYLVHKKFKPEDVNAFIAAKEAENPNWIAEYLRDVDADSFFVFNAAGIRPFGALFRDGNVLPHGKWYKLFFRGEYKKVPIIVGCNKEEAKIGLGALTKLNVAEFTEAFNSFDPDNPQLEIRDILDPVAKVLYKPLMKAAIPLVRQTFLNTIVWRLKKNQSDVYAYEFSWNDEPKPFSFLIGSAHATELPFVFGNFVPYGISKILWSKANRAGREKLSDTMMTYWANFMRTGDPNKGDVDLPGWRKWSNYLHGPKRIILDTDIYMNWRWLVF